MVGDVHYFGIRHHGPGSARRLLEALEDVLPVEVLIEGPSDLSDLIPMLSHQDMVPPVALLAYPAGEPERSIFWPFAVFSPEYQAICWAVKKGVPVRFIDLPVYWRLPELPSSENENEQTVAPNVEHDSRFGSPRSTESPTQQPPEQSGFSIERDPIGALARVAGYEDGESWWQDVIEENPEPGPIFAAVADAMKALRDSVAPPKEHEAAREAHMRLEIAKSLKSASGPIAVVCGAWHVPALKEKHSMKDDRELLKGVAKRKISATWTPWTAPRLAIDSGYAAGVTYPGWNKHLWETSRKEQSTRWMARTARCLREQGQMVSTASLIEAERLAVAIAAIRGRPRAGFEELIDATVACICYGNEIVWKSVADKMLVGDEVGVIPEGVPLAPLLEDLQKQQKITRLKPEALERELMLDLRSESGLCRSTLLHRLNALGVGWGQLDDPGGSRGTFRERWILRWEPEYSVQLVENLIYGATIEQAATGRIIASLPKAKGLGELSNLVFQALTAQLPEAAAKVSVALEHRAGLATDCQEMLTALPPIADALRYGKARHVDMGQMAVLFDRIAVQAALGLHHASRGLDDEAAGTFRDSIRGADRAIRLIDSVALSSWLEALRDIVDDERATALIGGQAARLLYESDQLSSDEAVTLLGRKLSPGSTMSEAAGFFEGFLEGAGVRLIHDQSLRSCINDWILEIDEESFVEALPIFRRVFSNLDKMERQRLLVAALGQETQHTRYVVTQGIDHCWSEHVQTIASILKGRADHE
ncbi:MAG: DUF5682 family protein [Pirellula sp.]|jgi:hypothetical protein|nr:DUF5682 family protein [Pirellula sp.]